MLVGDPDRAERVAGLFDDVTLTRRNREFVAHTGMHAGMEVTVLGTGMSTANMEISVIELCACFDTEAVSDLCMLRCGSTGALQDDIDLGDLVIAQGAFRMEATSTAFVGEGYPALAHPEVVLALAAAAEAGGHPYHVGIAATAASFYGAQGRDVPGFPPRYPNITNELARQGITNLEMEGSTLLTLASLRGFRAGLVCAVYATRTQGEFITQERKVAAEGACIETGLEALHGLAAMRAQRGSRPIWHPGLIGR
jgi:uridine phosphorylase